MTFNLKKTKADSSSSSNSDSGSAAKHPSGPVSNSDSSGNQGKRKRIRDRGIKWEEAYGEKSDDLKKRFEKKIGPNAYIRWEGHDYTTNGDYFVVVGPAVTKEGRKRFFSGIKRLPENPKTKVYSPSGEYFSTLHGALSHATDKWNIPFPKGTPNYSVDDLQGVKIPRHVKG